MSKINYKESKSVALSFEDDPDIISEEESNSVEESKFLEESNSVEDIYNQTEKIEKVVHKILTKMTSNIWEVVDISSHKSKGEICPICNIAIQSHTAKFSCSHYCCTSCLDNIADSYDKDCQDVLFECPICLSEIKNIEYC